MFLEVLSGTTILGTPPDVPLFYCTFVTIFAHGNLAYNPIRACKPFVAVIRLHFLSVHILSLLAETS